MTDNGPSLPLEAYPAYELALVLSAPRLLARAPKLPSQTEILRKLDGVLEFIGRMAPTPDNSVHLRQMRLAQPYLLELREACANWTPARKAPASLQLIARTALTSGFGTTAPPEGWDTFDLTPSDPLGPDDSIGECIPGNLGPLRRP